MYDLAVLTNAITDITVNVEDNDIKLFGLKKGSLNNYIDDYDKFLNYILHKNIDIYAAGSSANVAFNSTYFKMKSIIFGSLGNDYYAQNYIKDVKSYGIDSCFNITDGQSAVCYALITPDHERTFYTKVGVAGQYDFDFSKYQDINYFHTSGFELLTNQEKTIDAINYFKNSGSKISFDLSEPWIVSRFRKSLEYIISMVDVLFITEEEALTFFNEKEENLIYTLNDICPISVLKMGKKGSIVIEKNNHYKINPINIQEVSTNGAGDAYTAGFLYGILNKLNLIDCGKLGSELASKVCRIKKSHI